MKLAALQALKSEMLADPQGLGYAPFVAAGNHAALVALLNDPALGGTALNLSAVDADLVRCSIVASEYGSLAAADRNYLNFLLGGSSLVLTSTVKNWVQNLASFAASKAAVAALFSRAGSRAEIVTGIEGLTVTPQDVLAALAA